MSKVKNVIGIIFGILGVILGIIAINIAINAFLGGIQTVQSYSFKADDGKEIVFGFKRGFGGKHNEWDMKIHEDMGISLTRNSTMILSGYLATEEDLTKNEETLKAEATVIEKNKTGKKLSYSVYNYDGTYFCVGRFKKSETIGYTLWTVSEMEEEEALGLFSKFQGTRGFGYWAAWGISQLIDLLGDD